MDELKHRERLVGTLWATRRTKTGDFCKKSEESSDTQEGFALL